MSKTDVNADDGMRSKVKNSLLRYFESLGRTIADINDQTDLIRGTGATSDEGVEYAIELAELIGAEVPLDFNPFVHESGNRGMRFTELVEFARKFASA